MAEGWLVYYDIQTTGFEKPIHITQIAALANDDRRFSVYVKPKRPINKWASKKTGLFLRGKQLVNERGETIPSVSITQGLTQFLNFLSNQMVPGKPLILVNHYCQRYDTPVLLEAATNVKLEQTYRRCVYGEIDTYDVFKAERMAESEGTARKGTARKGKVRYSRKELVKRYLGKDYIYTENDAREHTRALRDLVNSQFEDKTILCQYTKRWDLL